MSGRRPTGHLRLELDRFFVDDAISGTSAVRRPAFQEMVDLAQQERRPFSYVIAYDVKRCGRRDNDEAGCYRHAPAKACAEAPPRPRPSPPVLERAPCSP